MHLQKKRISLIMLFLLLFQIAPIQYLDFRGPLLKLQLLMKVGI
jgi:hypothetical protein